MQVVDLLNERELTVTRIRPMLAQLGYRSLLAVPLLFEDHIMGALTVYRREAGSFCAGGRQPPPDLRDAISPGNPKRAAVPGDRG